MLGTAGCLHWAVEESTVSFPQPHAKATKAHVTEPKAYRNSPDTGADEMV